MNTRRPSLALLLSFVPLCMGQDLTDAPSSASLEPPAGFTKVAPVKGKTETRSAVYSTGDTPPVLTDFYWANQGSCVANTNPDGTITMFHPGAAGLTFNWCILAKPLPAAPYTIIYGVRGHILGKAASLASVLYDINTNKFIVYSLPGSSDAGTAALAAWRMNTPTTYIGSPAGIVFNYTNALATSGLMAANYVRLKDSGTIRTVAISADKKVWLTIFPTPNTDHMSGNWFGYALRGTGDGMASIMTIYHEEITTP